MIETPLLTRELKVKYNKAIHKLLESDEMPLKMIAEQLDLDVTQRQLEGWERRRDSNDFPEVSRTLGKYKFYHFAEVAEWVVHWKRIGQLGNKGLNNGKRKSR